MSNCTFQQCSTKMIDRYSEKILRFMHDCNEKKYDLLYNIDSIEANIRSNVEIFQHKNIPVSEKELLFIYTTKWLSLLSDLNHTILKFMETEILDLPTITKYLLDNRLTSKKFDVDSSEVMDLKTEILDATLKNVQNQFASNTTTPDCAPYGQMFDEHFRNSMMNNQHFEYIPHENPDEQENRRESSQESFLDSAYYDKDELESQQFDYENLVSVSLNDTASSVCTDYQLISENMQKNKEHVACELLEVQTNELTNEKQEIITDLIDNNVIAEKSCLNNINLNGQPDWATKALETPNGSPLLQKTQMSNMEECRNTKSLMANQQDNAIGGIASKINNTSIKCNSDLKLLEKHLKTLDRDNAIASIDKVKTWLNRTSQHSDESTICTTVAKSDVGKSQSELEQKTANIKFKQVPKRTASSESNIVRTSVIEKDSICVFSYIVSPSEFYLQIINDVNMKNEDTIEDYFSNTNLHIENKRPEFESKEDALTQLGNFCYGYIPKKAKWFRVEVLNWNLQDATNDVYVQAIDYGNKEMIPYSNLVPMTDKFKNIPALAIKCHFPMLYPLGSTDSNKLEWPEETVQSLYDMVNKKVANDKIRPKLFKVDMSYSERDSVAVDLMFFEEDIPISFRTVLIDLQFGVELENNVLNHSELEEFLQDVDDLENPDNLNELVVGYDAEDEKRVCRFTDKNGRCFKGTNCKAEHIVLQSGYTTDKLETFHGDNLMENDVNLTEGDSIQILITAYIDTCTYWVQIIQRPHKYDEIIMDEVVMDLMTQLHDSKIVSNYKKFKVAPALGELVLVYNGHIDMWLRAIICKPNINTNGESLFKVQSVDFGYELKVYLNDIRMMPEQFINIPKQAVKISLWNYRPNDTNDKKGTKRYFDNNIRCKNFMAFIKSTNPQIVARITTMSHIDIGTLLARDGLVIETTSQNDINNYCNQTVVKTNIYPG